MRAQLQRLADVSELPNVTIRVVPLEGNHVLAVESFSILQFCKAREPTLHDVVSIEHLHNELYVSGDTDTYQCRLAFDHLAEKSLTPEESRNLIPTVASHVRDSDRGGPRRGDRISLVKERPETDLDSGMPAPLVGGQICALFAVDIAGFTRPDRDDDIRMFMREELYRILERAFGGSGIAWTACSREDRGDGVLVVVPPGIAANGIIDPMPERLRSLIRRHNHVSSDAAEMQLRAAVHIGPVDHDGHGFVGTDVDFLFRILDAQPLRARARHLRRRLGSDRLRVRLQQHRVAPPQPWSARLSSGRSESVSSRPGPGHGFTSPAHRRHERNGGSGS